MPPEHPSFAAEQLRHDRARTHSARERLAVIAVGSDHVVVGADHRHHAGRDRFLSDVEVAESADLAERVRFGAALLEASLQEHRMKQLATELRCRSSEVVRRCGIGAVVARRAFLFPLLGGRGCALRVSAHTPAACTCSHA